MDIPWQAKDFATDPKTGEVIDTLIILTHPELPKNFGVRFFRTMERCEIVLMEKQETEKATKARQDAEIAKYR